VLHCHCGFEARGEDEEALVAVVRRHAHRAHGMALTDDEALLLAFRAELDEEAPTTIPRRSVHPDQEEER
jgi:hypothetical protein